MRSTPGAQCTKRYREVRTVQPMADLGMQSRVASVALTPGHLTATNATIDHLIHVTKSGVELNVYASGIGQQNQLPGRRSRCQCPMGSSGVCQRKGLTDVDLELAAVDELGTLLQDVGLRLLGFD